jgi:hypothetical protein
MRCGSAVAQLPQVAESVSAVWRRSCAVVRGTSALATVLSDHPDLLGGRCRWPSNSTSAHTGDLEGASVTRISIRPEGSPAVILKGTRLVVQSLCDLGLVGRGPL